MDEPDFIEKREKDKAALRIHQQEEYCRLAKRNASGTLEANQQRRFGELLDILGISTDQARKDERIFQQAIQLETKAAKLPAAAELRKQRRAEFDKVHADAVAAIAEIQKKENHSLAIYNAADLEFQELKRVDAQLRELMAQHWQLLGAEDPAVAVRRRHLVSELYTEKPTGKYDITSVEQIMRWPPESLCSLSQSEWVKLPDQDVAEFSRLVGIATELTNDAAAVKRNRSKLHPAQLPTYRYLLDAKEQSKVRNSESVIFVFASIAGYEPFSRSAIAAGQFRPVLAPSQTAAELEHLLDLIDERVAQLENAPRHRPDLATIVSRIPNPRAPREGVTTPLTGT